TFDKPTWKNPDNPGNPQLDLLENLTDFEESRDEFRYIENIMEVCQPKTVHEPTDLDDRRPRPSGWIPPPTHCPNLSYFVSRTKNHLLPVYFYLKYNGSQKVTKIKNIMGNIWDFETDLIKHLSEYITDKDFIPPTQINEYSQSINIKGVWTEEIKQFLANKGF
ncbi:unnamed protein product, partial [Gordionus sp. m RMFG-2023]